MRRIAHRGCPHLAPENSLQGFEAALGYRPDIVEMDVRLTRDGKAVVMHDATLDRTTDGTGKIAALTLAQVRACRLANGEPVPVLAGALDLLKGRCWIKLDVKSPGMAALVVAELRRVRAEDDAIVIAYGRKALAAFRAASPDLRLELGGVCTRHQRGASIKEALRSGAEIVSVRHQVVTKRYIAECGEHGIAVHAWTVNDRATFERMRAYGVSAVATDRIDVL